MKKILICLLIVFMALSINEAKAELKGSISGKVITDKDVPVEGAKLESKLFVCANKKT